MATNLEQYRSEFYEGLFGKSWDDLEAVRRLAARRLSRIKRDSQAVRAAIEAGDTLLAERTQSAIGKRIDRLQAEVEALQMARFAKEMLEFCGFVYKAPLAYGKMIPFRGPGPMGAS